LDKAAMAKVMPINGDISAPGLGMSQEVKITTEILSIRHIKYYYFQNLKNQSNDLLKK